MQIINMIISFDGNVFCGKTTLIKNLAAAGNFNVIPEYADFFHKTKLKKIYGDSRINSQLRYLEIDAMRMKKIVKSANLLDRSFISMSAHVYAIYKCDGIDIRKKYLELLKNFMKKKKIIMPDNYVFVHCPYGLAKQRFLRGFREKKTEKIYIEKKYFNAIDSFNKKWIKSAGGLAINSSVKFSEKNKKLIKFLASKRTLLPRGELIKILKKSMELK